LIIDNKKIFFANLELLIKQSNYDHEFFRKFKKNISKQSYIFRSFEINKIMDFYTQIEKDYKEGFYSRVYDRKGYDCVSGFFSVAKYVKQLIEEGKYSLR
jgi:pantothenate kinase